MAFIKPIGIRYTADEDEYCLYPDGMIGLREDRRGDFLTEAQPYLIKFDAFNPYHLTGDFLRSRLNSPEVLDNAQKYARRILSFYVDAKDYCDWRYDTEGNHKSGKSLRESYDSDDPIASHAFSYPRRLQSNLSEAIGRNIWHDTRDGVITAVCEHCAEISGLDPRQCKRLKQILREEWDSPYDKKSQLLTEFFENSFKESAQALEKNIGGIASRARNWFQSSDNKPELEKEGKRREDMVKAVKRSVDLLPKALRTIAEYNGMTLKTADTLWRDFRKTKKGYGKAGSYGITLATPEYMIVLEEVIHYCDRMLGKAKQYVAGDSFTDSSEFQAVFAAEKEAFTSLYEAMKEARYDPQMQQVREQRQNSEKGAINIIDKVHPDRHPGKLWREHLPNIWCLIEDFRQPHSFIRTLCKNAPQDEQAFFKDMGLGESYRLSIAFMQRCEEEAKRLEMGGKPVNRSGVGLGL